MRLLETILRDLTKARKEQSLAHNKLVALEREYHSTKEEVLKEAEKVS